MINENSSWDEVLVAVQEDGLAIEYASDYLRDDKEVALAAVNEDGRALEFVSEFLRKDKSSYDLILIKQTVHFFSTKRINLLLNLANISHDSSEMKRKQLAEIPYDW